MTNLVDPMAQPPVADAGYGWPLLRLGFRPFYLGATIFSALALPLWMLMYLGYLQLPLALPAPVWHAHEMLFGFAVAVIIGFLLTAGKAWTGLGTPRGGALAALVLLWLCARLAALWAPVGVYAVLDLALLPCVAAIFTTLLVRARNLRNAPIAVILWLLALANGVFHLSAWQVLDVNPLRAVHAALALVVMIECVIAGRIVPAFTISATPGLKLGASPWLERGTLALTMLALGSWIFLPPTVWSAALLAAAAVLHVARQWRWKPWVTRKRPILWILHVAYAWLAVGLALLALAQLGWVSPSVGIHALAVGLTGGLIIGMVTRTARGHTGRSLQVSRAEVLAYTLVMAAAVLRVVVPLVLAPWLIPALIAATMCWGIAFAIYAVKFAPWLWSVRLDGKDG